MKTNVRRRGFTLPEVLVTVTIVAVLAAVVVPAVLNQVDKGDDAAVAQDIIAIRTALTTFVADTRKFPERITDLGLDVLPTGSDDIDGNDYGSAAAAAYKGPYINIGTSHTSPAGVRFRNSLFLVTNQVCMADTVIAATAGATLDQALQLERLLEATSDATTGVVRWTPSVAAPTDSIVPGTLRVCLVNRG
jgi:prepilin-type N-terminal cleavage/methylation domain-containing protein